MEYGIDPVIADPEADEGEAKRLYGIEFSDMNEINGMDAVVLAVAHDEFCKLRKSDIDGLYGNGKKLLMDLKGILDRKEFEADGYFYWRL